MKVAVFGASGVVGSRLVSRLVGEHEVTAVSRQPRSDESDVRWAVADVGDPTAVREALDGIDVVY